MPIALLIVGIFLAVAGIKNNAATVGTVLKDDFSGAGSFWYWIAAVVIIGSVGYYTKAETVSRMFLVLIVLVFALSNEGIYSRIVAALENPQPAPSNDAALGADTKTPGEGKEPGEKADADEKAASPLDDYSAIPNPFDIFGSIGKDITTTLFPFASFIGPLLGGGK